MNDIIKAETEIALAREPDPKTYDEKKHGMVFKSSIVSLQYEEFRFLKDFQFTVCKASEIRRVHVGTATYQ